MQKKNKVLFFIFSLVPGAAHMYMGLIKRGIVIMGLFMATIGLSLITYTDALLLILPLVWCYSFFDAWNKYNLPEDKFEKIRDDFFFMLNVVPENIKNDPRIRKISSKGLLKGLGVVAIFLGAYMIIDRVVLSLLGYFTDTGIIVTIIGEVSRKIPQIAIAVLLIFVGVKLIANKKQQLESEEESFDGEDE